MAEIVIEGSKLHLKDIAIYTKDGIPITGVTKELFQVLRKFKYLAKANGFESLQISGKRFLDSTSANPGKIVDITINLF